MTTSNLSDEVIDGFWVIQWRLKRTPGRYGHYFLSYSEEYPDDIKVKNKNLYLDSEGGYKKDVKKDVKQGRKGEVKKEEEMIFTGYFLETNLKKINKIQIINLMYLHMFNLCKYKNILGKPNEGIRKKYRLFNISLM